MSVFSTSHISHLTSHLSRRTFLGAAALAATASRSKAAQTSAPFRVGVIGRTGKGDYGHALDTIWLDIPAARIVAVADEDAAGREAAGKRLGASKLYADFREMLDREQLDIVTVAPRWADCHRDMVIACAEHGCHILMEKPMARDLVEADQMVAAVEKAGVKAAIAHTARHMPGIHAAKRLVLDGRIGDLVELRGRGKEDRRGGGEDLMVLGVHILDLMRLFAGDPRWCFANVTEGGRPVGKGQVREGVEGIGPLAGDQIAALYGFEGPARGSFGTHRAAHGAGTRYGLHLCGTKGMLTIAPDGPEVWLMEDPAWGQSKSKAIWQPVASLATRPADAALARESYRLFGLDLLAAIELNREPRCNLRDGRAAIEMVLAVYESHRQGKAVHLPLHNREHPLKRL